MNSQAERQMTFDFDRRRVAEKAGAVLRDVGIMQAVANAEVRQEGWNERADVLFALFLAESIGGGQFMVEDVRAFAEGKGLPVPPSNRAWGGVVVRAARKGLVRRVGFGCVKNPLAHGTPAAVWERIRE